MRTLSEDLDSRFSTDSIRFLLPDLNLRAGTRLWGREELSLGCADRGAVQVGPTGEIYLLKVLTIRSSFTTVDLSQVCPQLIVFHFFPVLFLLFVSAVRLGVM